MLSSLPTIFKKAEGLVQKVLEEEPQTRSDDVDLVIAVWERQGVHLSEDQKRLIHKLYSSETITRCRRKIQERGLFLPIESKVKQRSLLENNFHEHFKKSNKEKPQYIFDAERQIYIQI